MKAKHYYEVHVTVEPPADEARLRYFCQVAAAFGYHVSEFLMLKGANQPKAFCSTRGQDYEETVAGIRDIVGALKEEGFVVLRYKIEDTLMDSRISDDMKLIQG